MSERSLLIVNAVVNPGEREALAYYQQEATPMFVAAGGKPVGKFKISESLIGEADLHMAVVMEFPNDEAIKGVFDSEAYQELIPYREKAFKELNVYIGNS